MIKKDQQSEESRRRLVRIASTIANPTSAPVLAKMVSRRRLQRVPRAASASSARQDRSCSPTKNRVTPSTAAAAASSSKYDVASTVLWMKRPSSPSCDIVSDSYQSQSHTRLDLQTNNSKKEGSFDSQGNMSSTGESTDFDGASHMSDSSLENKNAVAKGADAMVKMSLSRQTEIIDTSKLVEEGKVETEYIEDPEVIEEQDHAMVDEYEKGFAYARRLRALLNMQFKEVDKGSIETNFLMVKAHEHPTQRMIDRWRNVDLGQSYTDQVRRQKLIEDFRINAVKKKSKKGDEPVPVYPDLLRFTVRFRKANSERRWKDYMAFRQKQKKQQGNKGGPVPKPNDKYLFSFQDLWSNCVVVFVKPSATVRDIIDPIFARIGLDRRADFSYTIGCFNNDKRAGKAKILGVPNVPEPVEMYQIASELYKKNCTEIYVNDNRCEMFAIFPDYYARGMPKKPGEEEKKSGKKGKKGKKDKKDKDNKKAAPAAGNAAPAAAPAPGTNNKSNAAVTTDGDDDDHMTSTATTTALPAQATAAPDSTTSPGSQSGRRRASLLRDEAAAFEEATTPPSERRRLTIVEESSSG